MENVCCMICTDKKSFQGQDSPRSNHYYLSLWLAIFQSKTLLVEKTVIVEHGESQPRFQLVFDTSCYGNVSLLIQRVLVAGVSISFLSLTLICLNKDFKMIVVPFLERAILFYLTGLRNCQWVLTEFFCSLQTRLVFWFLLYCALSQKLPEHSSFQNSPNTRAAVSHLSSGLELGGAGIRTS